MRDVNPVLYGYLVGIHPAMVGGYVGIIYTDILNEYERQETPVPIVTQETMREYETLKAQGFDLEHLEPEQDELARIIEEGNKAFEMGDSRLAKLYRTAAFDMLQLLNLQAKKPAAW